MDNYITKLTIIIYHNSLTGSRGIEFLQKASGHALLAPRSACSQYKQELSPMELGTREYSLKTSIIIQC